MTMLQEPLNDVERLATEAYRPAPSPARRWLHRLAPPLALAALIGAGALFGGFLVFLVTLEAEPRQNEAAADGIVALTGGSDRISDAVELLAEGKGKRLLISGVNRSTSPERLANTMPQHVALFDCCIDMDYQARNTLGNAVETRRWAEARSVRSLIVVTSSYHMPRAMLELQRAMPGIELRPHPVVAERQDANAWRGLAATKLLATEYGKFLAAYVRASIFPVISHDISTGSLRHTRNGGQHAGLRHGF